MCKMTNSEVCDDDNDDDDDDENYDDVGSNPL